ncbi:hypothetical protein TanjilG_25198 [Lupinus angustifolius]|uniref:CASP-like protein n=1 Tax=Lupinus angustifolius TaxID=3871 RepID=A0A1J7H3K8_LUPAN|nr:hypothetical protein TanjilG_25198 [Lupinus angustifolius]
MLKLFDSSLRLCVVPLSVATIWVTVTNQQDNSIYGMLKYSNILGLKYMVFVSALCAVYALVAVASSWVRYLILAYLMITSVSASMEIYSLAYNGAKNISWSEACSSYGRFCSKVKLAIILHVFTFCCFLVLAVISASRVFSVYDPPSVISIEMEEERG